MTLMPSVRNLLALCATSVLFVFARAEASAELSHDIAAQPLVQALNEFAAQTGLQVIYVSRIAANRVSKGAPSGLRAADAMQRLLADTGLHFEFLNDRAVRVFEGSRCALELDCAGPRSPAAVLAAEKSSEPHAPFDPLEEVI